MSLLVVLLLQTAGTSHQARLVPLLQSPTNIQWGPSDFALMQIQPVMNEMEAFIIEDLDHHHFDIKAHGEH